MGCAATREASSEAWSNSRERTCRMVMPALWRARARWVATLPDPMIETVRRLAEQPVLVLLIFVFFKEKVFLGGVVGPDIFDAFILIAFIFYFLKVFDYFKRCAAANGVVDKFLLGSWPGSVFEF